MGGRGGGYNYDHTIIMQRVSYQFVFIRFSICLQCKISESSVFSIFFPHKVSYHKVRKVWSQFFKKTSDRLGLEKKAYLKKPQSKDFRVLEKSYPFRYDFLTQHKSANVFLTFCKNNMFAKNLILDLWSKNLKTNQTAGFFKLLYLTKSLRYEVEFLDMTRGSRKH